MRRSSRSVTRCLWPRRKTGSVATGRRSIPGTAGSPAIRVGRMEWRAALRRCHTISASYISAEEFAQRPERLRSLEAKPTVKNGRGRIHLANWDSSQPSIRRTRGASTSGWRSGRRQVRPLPKRLRQLGIAHEEGVDAAGGFAAFGDRPDYQRLAAAHVARCKHSRYRGHVVIVRLDVAAVVEIHA